MQVFIVTKRAGDHCSIRGIYQSWYDAEISRITLMKKSQGVGAEYILYENHAAATEQDLAIFIGDH